MSSPPELRFTESDGGRAAAGFRGDAGDCLVRALVHVTGRDFRRVWEDAKSWNRSVGVGSVSPRHGVEDFEGFLASLGFVRFFVDHSNPLPVGHNTLRFLGGGGFVAITEFGTEEDHDLHAVAVVGDELVDNWDSRCLPGTTTPAPCVEAWRPR